MKKLGWKPDYPHPHRLMYHKYFPLEVGKVQMLGAPVRVDLRSICGPIKTQFYNDCTGHGISGALECLENMELPARSGAEQFSDGKYDPISAMFIYWHERSMRGQEKQDDGAMIADGIATVRGKGFVRESTWPETQRPTTCPSPAAWSEAYGHREFYGFSLENQDMTQIKASLVAGFPVIFGTVLFESFMNPGPSGLIAVPQPNFEDEVGGHCMLIVGYDDVQQRVIVKNSWGTDWGDHGYCYMPYSILGPQYASAFWTLRASGAKL